MRRIYCRFLCIRGKFPGTWQTAEEGKGLQEKPWRRSRDQNLRMIDRQKEFTGILKDYDETTVTIEMEDETEKTFEKSEIALIRLAFDF